MKSLAFYLLVFLGISSLANAANTTVDECAFDLYFANGMLGDSKDDENIAWKEYVESLQQYNPKINAKSTAKVAYNSSGKEFLKGLGAFDDFLEASLQYTVGQVISYARLQREYVAYLHAEGLIDALDAASQSLNYQDLKTQIMSYKEDIKSGHGVIVVAHSQGNFFTNKAYEYLDGWMQAYFHMIGVASPSHTVVKGGPRISFDNDPVAWLSGMNTITNQNRNRSTSGVVDMPTLAYHEFNYYMGEPVTVNDLGETKQVSTTQAYTAINGSVLSMIDKHAIAPSQWQKTTTPDNMTDIPEACINRDSCDKKAYYVKHISNTREMNSLMGQTKVLVFEERAKNTNLPKIQQYLTQIQALTNYTFKQQTTRTHS